MQVLVPARSGAHLRTVERSSHPVFGGKRGRLVVSCRSSAGCYLRESIRALVGVALFGFCKQSAVRVSCAVIQDVKTGRPDRTTEGDLKNRSCFRALFLCRENSADEYESN